MNKPATLVTLLLTAVLAAAGCSKKGERQQGPGAPVAVVKGVVLETVRSAALPETLEVVGTLRARTSAVVLSRLPGTVSLLRVREGDRVRKGQLLAQLEAQESQATAAAASAGSDEARQALEEALSRKKLADATFERYRNLLAEQAVSRQEFEVRQAEKEQAGQGVARAEARLKQAREGSRAAGAMADYSKIIAPISGVVTARQIDLGATVFPAQPLMIIEEEGSYQLELAIPESMVARVRPGTAVQVSLDAVGSAFAARVGEIVPAADPASRTFTAKIDINRTGLRSGMFGRGSITLDGTVAGLLVPRKAVVERGALTSVWVLDSGNIARMRLVKLGKPVGDKVEILSGLSDGERLVVGGVEKISEGIKVE